MVMTPGDLLASPGLAERGFWDEVELGAPGNGAVALVPGRPFPGLGWAGGGRLHERGEDTAAVLAELEAVTAGAGARP